MHSVQNVTFDQQELGKADSFTYLRSVVSQTGGKNQGNEYIHQVNKASELSIEAVFEYKVIMGK